MGHHRPLGARSERDKMCPDGGAGRKAVAVAIHSVSYTGMCGALNFSGGPAPGVAIINPVGVQWKKSTGKYPFEMKVVDNSLNKDVPIEADLQPTNP
jgi:hypothetical protein